MGCAGSANLKPDVDLGGVVAENISQVDVNMAEKQSEEYFHEVGVRTPVDCAYVPLKDAIEYVEREMEESHINDIIDNTEDAISLIELEDEDSKKPADESMEMPHTEDNPEATLVDGFLTETAKDDSNLLQTDEPSSEQHSDCLPERNDAPNALNSNSEEPSEKSTNVDAAEWRSTRWEALADALTELPPKLSVDAATGQIFIVDKAR